MIIFVFAACIALSMYFEYRYKYTTEQRLKAIEVKIEKLK